MLKKSIATAISMALFAAGPVTAAAQALSHGAMAGINTAPMIVTGLHSPVQTASLVNVTAPSVIAVSPAITSAAVIPALAPAAKITVVAPVAASPLSSIQSEKSADKAPALRALFDNSLQSASSLEREPVQKKLSTNSSRDEFVDNSQTVNNGNTGLAGGTEAGLNNNNDPHGPRIKLFAYQSLLKAGVKHPLTDVRELMKPGAEAKLLELGFKREPDSEGTRIYLLGLGSLGNNGQRVAFYKNGSVSLASVSQPGTPDSLSIQTISLDDAGYIFNATEFFGNSSPSANIAAKGLISMTQSPKEIDLGLLTPAKALALLHKQFPKEDFAALMQEARDAMPDGSKPIGKLRFFSLMQKAHDWTLRLGGQFRLNGSIGYFDAAFEWDGVRFVLSDSNSNY